MTLANKFTISRLIMVIPFIILMTIVCFMPSSNELLFSPFNKRTILFETAGILFVIAMITDALDGYIARKTNTVTTFGKLFDPLADKFMTTSAFVFLGVLHIIPIPVVVLFILRDILVDGSRNIAAKSGKEVAANNWGKMKTVMQTIAIMTMFFLWPISENYHDVTMWSFHTLNLPTYVALILSLISGFIYLNNIKTLIKIK